MSMTKDQVLELIGSGQLPVILADDGYVNEDPDILGDTHEIDLEAGTVTAMPRYRVRFTVAKEMQEIVQADIDAYFNNFQKETIDPALRGYADQISYELREDGIYSFTFKKKVGKGEAERVQILKNIINHHLYNLQSIVAKYYLILKQQTGLLDSGNANLSSSSSVSIPSSSSSSSSTQSSNSGSSSSTSSSFSPSSSSSSSSSEEALAPAVAPLRFGSLAASSNSVSSSSSAPVVNAAELLNAMSEHNSSLFSFK